MKQFIALSTLIILLTSANGFCQNVSETTFGVGVNKLQSNNFRHHYDEECSPPTVFNLEVSHSWFQTDKKLTFNKEIGLNLQYSKPSLSSGGLGGHSYSQWKIANLFAEATVQARFRVDSVLSIGFGPAIEYLIVGYNELQSSYYLMINTPRSGEYNHSGFNRDYFSDPFIGMRFSFFNSSIGKRATLKVNLSYFWTKESDKSFHSSKYIKVGLAIGFKHKKHSETLATGL